MLARDTKKRTMRLSNVSAVAATLVAVAGTAWADTPGPGDYYGHMMGGYGYDPGFFGVGTMILIMKVQLLVSQ